jgi:hypothetical protein
MPRDHRKGPTSASQAMLSGRAVWRSITRAARLRPVRAFIAVPYFGKQGPLLLPVGRGSRMVVNASPNAVKSGQTSPAALLKMHRRGIDVFSYPQLHAKVYVFGTTAYIGSANASGSSAESLVEAAIRSTDRVTVRDAREFVRKLSRTLVPLGEEQLSVLEELYREPKRAATRGSARSISRSRNGPRVWIVRTHEADLPDGAEEAHERGLDVAQASRSHRRFEVDSFWHARSVPYRRGDTIVEVVTKINGSIMVSPPGTVIRRSGWRRGNRKLSFTYYERPAGRRIGFARLTKKLGLEAKRRLDRSGPIADCALRDELLAHFSS